MTYTKEEVADLLKELEDQFHVYSCDTVVDDVSAGEAQAYNLAARYIEEKRKAFLAQKDYVIVRGTTYEFEGSTKIYVGFLQIDVEKKVDGSWDVTWHLFGTSETLTTKKGPQIAIDAALADIQVWWNSTAKLFE